MNKKAFKQYVKFNWRRPLTVEEIMRAGVISLSIPTIYWFIHNVVIEDLWWVYSINFVLGALTIFIMNAVRYGMEMRNYEVIDRAFGIPGEILFSTDLLVANFAETGVLRQERIIASAMLMPTGEVYIAHEPGRHHHCVWLMRQDERQLGRSESRVSEGEQGFLTNHFRFLDRVEAALFVEANGPRKTLGNVNRLYSEDLWDTPEHVTRAAYLQSKFDRKKK